jgi:hypothetical protein
MEALTVTELSALRVNVDVVSGVQLTEFETMIVPGWEPTPVPVVVTVVLPLARQPESSVALI